MNKHNIFFMSKYLHLRDNWLLCSGQKFWEIVAATIEDLAFGIRSSRDKKMGTGPIFSKGEDTPDLWTEHQKMGPVPIFLRVCMSEASYADAEKGEWRMALKI